MAQTIGRNKFLKRFIIGAKILDKISAFDEANDFGTISPKIKTTTVIIPVVNPITAESKYLAKTTVAKEAAPIFTTLFPINIVIRRDLGSAFNFLTNLAFLLPETTMASILDSFKVKKTTSAEEKKADKKINNINTKKLGSIRLLCYIKLYF